jgi:hypothetical protein
MAKLPSVGSRANPILFLCDFIGLFDNAAQGKKGLNRGEPLRFPIFTQTMKTACPSENRETEWRQQFQESGIKNHAHPPLQQNFTNNAG